MVVISAYPRTLYFQGFSGFFFIFSFLMMAEAAVFFELYNTPFGFYRLCNIIKDNNKA